MSLSISMSISITHRTQGAHNDFSEGNTRGNILIIIDTISQNRQNTIKIMKYEINFIKLDKELPLGLTL